MKRFITAVLLLCLSFSIHAQVKRVLLEDFSATWCGYCPDGQVAIDTITAAHPLVVTLSYHVFDTMQNDIGMGLNDAFGLQGYPDGMVDRKVFVGGTAPMNRAYWGGYTNSELNTYTPLDISLSSVFDSTTYIATVNVDVHYYNADTGFYYLNVCLKENDVHDTDAAFSQVNYYNIVVGHPAYGLGDPIPNYHHHSVHRQSFTGLFGDSLSIPFNALAGHYTATYTDTVTGNYNLSKMEVTAFVCRRHTGGEPTQATVLNVNSVPLLSGTSTAIAGQSGTGVPIFASPNPVRNITTLNYFLVSADDAIIELYDSFGRKIKSLQNKKLKAGIYSEPLDMSNLESGIYFLKLKTNSGESVSKVIKVD